MHKCAKKRAKIIPQFAQNHLNRAALLALLVPGMAKMSCCGRHSVGLKERLQRFYLHNYGLL
jgi:hypothetical protein